MNFKNFSAIDKFLLVSSLLIGGAVSYLITHEQLIYKYLNLTGRSKYGQVGVVSSKDRDVRRRMGDSFAWFPLHQDETLYEKDTIFSGSKSEVKFKLEEGGDFTLNENSLIVLNKNNGDFLLDIQRGGLIAKLDTKTKLKIIQDNKTVEIQSKQGGQKLRIRRNRAGNISLFSQSKGSKVKLKYGGKDFSLDGSNEVSFGKDGSKEKNIPVRLLDPKNEARVLIQENNAVNLKWSSSSKAVNPSLWKIQVGATPNFDSVTKELSVSRASGKIVALLPPNKKYYWRMVKKKSGGETRTVSGIHQFYAVDGKAPKHIFPVKDFNLYALDDLRKGESRPVNFRWKILAGFDSYKLQLGTQPGFDVILSEKVVKDKALLKLSLYKGTYYWRIQGVYGAKVKTAWSDGIRFLVGKQKSDYLPEPVVEPEVTPAVTEPPVEEPPPPIADTEVLSKSSKSQFSKAPRVAGKSRTHVLKFKGSQGKVRDVAALKKSLVNPPKFKWKAVSGANEYQFQVSKLKNMKTSLISRKLPGLGFTWTSTQPGDYYWRVRGLNRGKGQRTPYSKVQTLKVRVEAPVLESVKDQLRSVDSVDLIKAPSAPIQLNWTDRPFSSNYEVRANLVGGGKKSSVVKRVTASNHGLVLPEPGDYTIKVAALSQKGKPNSAFSKVKRVKYKTSIQLSTPEIRVPDDNTVMVSFSDSVEPIIFDWKAVKTAKIYRLQFSLSPNFENILLEKRLSKTQFLLTKSLNSSKIYWRIRSEALDYFSPWTQYRSFGYQKVSN